VLRGEMSLVGPRPPIAEEVVQYEPWQLRRLDVVPGITCLWQISGRSRIGFQEWMRLDLEYIRRRSFRLDLKILIRTIPAVLSREGAY
jgi:lipopolysaccharide/colanic/teichoic acid biosynthesis glycosyltransferase